MAVFKVHTDTFGRLIACIQHAMYGVTSQALQEMPIELRTVETGDIVFISEKEVSNNALFGPFYIVNDRPNLAIKKKCHAWNLLNPEVVPANEIAYWVIIENRHWCLLFDKTLADRISIVWPWNWNELNVNLPSWGQITGEDSKKLLDFAIKNEIEAREFFRRHKIR